MKSLTKRYRTLYAIFAALSFLSFAGPSIFFVTRGFVTSTLVTEKLALTTTLLIVVILSIVAVINKIALRSQIWILFFGLYFVIPEISPVIISIGIGQILHEIIFDPLRVYAKKRYIIHKEMDKRDKQG